MPNSCKDALYQLRQRLRSRGVPKDKLTEAIAIIEAGMASVRTIHRYISLEEPADRPRKSA